MNLSKKDTNKFELHKHSTEESIMSLADRIISEKRLTTAERNALPSSAFADPKNRKFPMNDKAHIRNARAREHFASSKVKMKIDAKAKKVLPSDKEESLSSRILGNLSEAKAKLGSGARFKSLEKKLSNKGAKTPGALASWIGRKKFGKAKFSKLSAHGKHTYTESKHLDTTKALIESLSNLRKAVLGDKNGQKG